MMMNITENLKELVHLAANEKDLDEVFNSGLSWLDKLAPYDLTTIFILQDARLVVRATRGPLASKQIYGHTLSLNEFPSLREILDTRRARAFTENDHTHGDGDPFDGILDLPPGHSCMVVPLCAGNQCLGLLTLDRTHCETYPQRIVDLVEIYGHILALAIQNAEKTSHLKYLYQQGNEQIKLLEAETRGETDDILNTTQSPIMKELANRTRLVSQTETPILILGESGTGKERLANAIHRWSARIHRPFIKINCSAIPHELLESELFGYVKGAFTGAEKNRLGRFQIADGGTLFLDEIGDMPMSLQPKLLRVLQEGTLEPLGSDQTIKVDVRIIASTNVSLDKAVNKNKFREDLYYRLNVFPLQLPPLRDRLEDLPELCRILLSEQALRTRKKDHRVTPDGMSRLASYHWPGNIRELANILERATILSKSKVLGEDVFELPSTGPGEKKEASLFDESRDSGFDEIVPIDEMQRRYIRFVLTRTKGRIYGNDGAARLLAMKPTTLQSRIKKLGIQV
ncbi:MAG: sigma 54-interacting transcriptional regulator [SAR324 cluster bacterium]|nr:sigma 54-interacting transcriptional regulator [SAR324 cluster bacterium]